jgi:hypothetical protein
MMVMVMEDGSGEEAKSFYSKKLFIFIFTPAINSGL